MRQYVLFLAVILTLSGCISLKKTGFLQPSTPAISQPQSKIIANPTITVSPLPTPARKEIIGALDDAITEIPIGRDVLIPFPVSRHDRLPDTVIDNFSAMGIPAVDAFRLLLKNTNIALLIDEDASMQTVSILNVTGLLPEVIESISNATGLHYSFKDGVLHIKKKQGFVVMLPPVDPLFKEVPKMIKALGGEDIQVDQFSRMLAFKAAKQSYMRIQAYLDQIRKNKVLIVYDTYIWDVAVNDIQKPAGLDWGRFLGTGGSASVDYTSSYRPSTAQGPMVYNFSEFDLKGLYDFLKTEGAVRTISKPVLTHLSGTRSDFHVGNSDVFVSKIGSSTNGEQTNTTVETEKLDSGLKLSLAGDYQDKTIYLTMNVDLSDITSYQNFKALGTELRLPQTSKRTVSTSARVRPGDFLLLAGMNHATDTSKAKSGLSFSRGQDHSLSRSEVVMVIRPRIVRFVAK